MGGDPWNEDFQNDHRYGLGLLRLSDSPAVHIPGGSRQGVIAFAYEHVNDRASSFNWRLYTCPALSPGNEKRQRWAYSQKLARVSSSVALPSR